MELPTVPETVCVDGDNDAVSLSVIVKVCAVCEPNVAPLGLDNVISIVSPLSAIESSTIVANDNVDEVEPAGIVNVPLPNV